jgi:hypothetical protein
MTDFPQPAHKLHGCSLYVGDCMDVLKTLPGESVQCVVTSPPYWGLRDYGTGTWDGGDAGCEHRRPGPSDDSAALPRDGHRDGFRHGKGDTEHANEPYRDTCPKCGARRIDKQLGLEATPAEYITNLVEIFREVRRVMRPDAVCFVNMGDSYAGGKQGRDDYGDTSSGLNNAKQGSGKTGVKHSTPTKQRTPPPGLKPKDLVGMPWRLALALQADGWWLRSALPWVKRSAMPESAEDRPTSALEYVFMLTKQPRYYFDMEAVRRPAAPATIERDRYSRILEDDGPQSVRHDHETQVNPGGRAWRNGDLWFQSIKPPHGLVGVGDELVGLDVTSKGFPGAHFATFCEDFVAPFILAGTSDKGCCPVCGAPWRRVVERSSAPRNQQSVGYDYGTDTAALHHNSHRPSGAQQAAWKAAHPDRTIGWEPGCGCYARAKAGKFLPATNIQPIPVVAPCVPRT